ncbi:hypothetical protein BD560DRAFT_441563 [Blakeslea trispora]|nr:hypothetical protein BD560DRAFT_441563 [Blakeslea trispora]
MEIPYTTTNSIVKRIQERDTLLPSAPPGSTSKADERTMRHLDWIVTNNPLLNIDGVRHELEKLEMTVDNELMNASFQSLKQQIISLLINATVIVGISVLNCSP